MCNNNKKKPSKKRSYGTFGITCEQACHKSNIWQGLCTWRFACARKKAGSLKGEECIVSAECLASRWQVINRTDGRNAVIHGQTTGMQRSDEKNDILMIVPHANALLSQ
ncbi:hypothetical protein JTE90_029656 [Oedothorax gibbosus]|uniref:Uncharacterized protein n=1 Tax=Oedothorax gibbosus TaxID=931172 RepID=A0AAV6VGG3_9ARAC|nr:hypothetical protein JTE90_029656 [Oedothorax gibbosus]